MKKLVVLLLLCSGTALPASWKKSILVLSGAVALDCASSYGRPELNPMYGPSFRARGLSLRLGMLGGMIAAQALVRRNNPQAERFFIPVNYGAAGVTGSVAFTNYLRR